MADSNYPILVFPESVPADRETRRGFGRMPRCPKVGIQGERHGSQLQRLVDALENRRIALQDSSLGIEPELVLVLKTVGSLANFFRAVQKVEGLAWLAEYEVKDIAPDCVTHAVLAKPYYWMLQEKGRSGSCCPSQVLTRCVSQFR